jgi:hypothetical protein
MVSALLLCGALLAAACGMAWLAFAMLPHWRQVRGDQPLSRGTRRSLRILGGAALAVAFALCLGADHASIAVLVWIMASSAAALGVALLLAWQPRGLRWLVAFFDKGSSR